MKELVALACNLCVDDTERQWYLRAVFLFGWSKLELAAKLDDEAHLKMILAPQEALLVGGPYPGNLLVGRRLLSE